MQKSVMSHDEARSKVCAICTNQWGNKAARKVNKSEEEFIQNNILVSYSSSNQFFPNGICLMCLHQVNQIKKGIATQLKLSESYQCHMERVTRSVSNVICQCEWCELARMNGPAFKVWAKKVKGKEKPIIERLCQKCYMGIRKGGHHVCTVSNAEAVRNLADSLPKDVKEKLALEILREKQNEVGCLGDKQHLSLPNLYGGRPTEVTIGEIEAKALPVITHDDIITMGNSAHLTHRQITSSAADLRVKLGRGIIEPGLRKGMVDHNNMYSEFFSSEYKLFYDNHDQLVPKAFFWCHDVKSFLDCCN